MPKVGMEPLRRDALIRATMKAVGAAGSHHVTVQQIAGRAGTSPALAHHHFGSRDAMFIDAHTARRIQAIDLVEDCVTLSLANQPAPRRRPADGS